MRLTFFALVGLVLLAPSAGAQVKKAAPVRHSTTPPGTGGYLGGTDGCLVPIPIAGQGVFPFDNTAATTGTQGQNEALCFDYGTSGIEHDVWFCWTSDATGCATMQTCGLTQQVDTKIAAYPGCGCPANGSALACNDDNCIGTLESKIIFPVVNGGVYTLQVGTFPSSPGGLGALDISIAAGSCLGPPSNDGCAAALAIAGQGQTSFDTTSATTGTQGQNELLCNQFGTSGIQRDVWYDWTADCSGTALLTICNLSNVDTKVAVYPNGGCPVDGTSLACNDDVCGYQSELSWPAAIGLTYTIQVGVFPGSAGGPGAFDISISPCSGVGNPLCFGDGSGTSCPCGNDGGTGEGCANSSGAGSTLDTLGSNSVGAGDLVLTASNALPGQPGLFFQGDNFINGGNGVLFGDGLRCCGANVVRLQVVVPDGNGYAATTTNIAASGGVAPGDTKCYQYWYRDPSGSPCGLGFNLTNAFSVDWVP